MLFTHPGSATDHATWRIAVLRRTAPRREGIHRTCGTTVLDCLPEHRDSLLSEDERATNATMMTCVGRARSDRLVLDL